MSKYKNILMHLLVAAVGGGIASAVAAFADPDKYSFPKDLGSGKLWPFFFQGAGLAVGALLLKSPMGQKLIGAFKSSQQQAQEDKAALESAKQELKESLPAKEGKKK